MDAVHPHENFVESVLLERVDRVNANDGLCRIFEFAADQNRPDVLVGKHGCVHDAVRDNRQVLFRFKILNHCKR